MQFDVSMPQFPFADSLTAMIDAATRQFEVAREFFLEPIRLDVSMPDFPCCDTLMDFIETAKLEIKGLAGQQAESGPKVVIYQTNTFEGFMDSASEEQLRELSRSVAGYNDERDRLIKET